MRNPDAIIRIKANVIYCLSWSFMQMMTMIRMLLIVNSHVWVKLLKLLMSVDNDNGDVSWMWVQSQDIVLFYHFLTFVNLSVINPHRVSLLCCWHYQLAVTFHNGRVEIIFKAIKSRFILLFELLCQHLMKSRRESWSVQLMHALFKHFKTSKYLVSV